MVCGWNTIEFNVRLDVSIRFNSSGALLGTVTGPLENLPAARVVARLAINIIVTSTNLFFQASFAFSSSIPFLRILPAFLRICK